MGWGNSSNVITTSLDSGSDSPATARGHLKAACDELKAVIDGRGAASGVASLDSSTKIPIAQIPITPALTGRLVDLTPGTGKTFTFPAGVTAVRVRAVGGGGGGGYTSTGTGGNHGGGGGGGGMVEALITGVAGSSTITYNVGAGGTGALASPDVDGNGTAGTDSLFTSSASCTPASTTWTAKGGGGGQGPSTRYGGAGGDCTVNDATKDIQRQGGSGASGATLGGMGGAGGDGTPAVSGFNAARHSGGGGGFGGGVGGAAYDGLPGNVTFEW